MELHVISSSSAGNAYALVAENGDTLLIEAGVPFKEVIKTIGVRNFVATIISHRHGDHAKCIRDYLQRCPVYCNEDVASTLNATYNDIRIINQMETYHDGAFAFSPFEVKHDVPSFGYIINHKEMGSMLFVTDTYTLPFAFQGVRHFLIEANYDEELLREKVKSGDTNSNQAARIAASHMSLQQCINNLKDCNAQTAETITLCHLSSRHSKPEFFRDTVASAFGVPTYIASKKSVIPLSLWTKQKQ